MKKIAVVFNGGTISMKVDERIQAAVPSLSAEEIMAMVTGIEGFAKVESHSFSSLPSPYITPDIMLDLSKFVQKLVSRDDIDGVVITHGTDTLEETAYFIDLTIKTDKPIVITGAMRSSSELGYDGPFNLAASICTAISDEAKGRGVLVCFNGELNSASEVTKANSMSLNAFRTPNFGPIGIVDNNEVIFYRDVVEKTYMPIEGLNKKVGLVKCVTGMDEDVMNFYIDNNYAGLVIEAMGRGNVPPNIVPVIQRAIDKEIIVVVTSRCFEGRVFESYGYVGGGKNLRDLGVIFGEVMPGQKARIKLLIALSSKMKKDEIQGIFEMGRYKK